ncbi:MAG: ATP-binding cassette domain-containing protein [Pseudomonadota bacterium]
MLQLTDVSLRRGTELLFEQASATLLPGRRIGLIGANGTGKSSLFSLLRGELAPDAGSVSIPGDWRVAHLEQELGSLDRPALEVVLDGDPGLRAAEREVQRAERCGDGVAIARAHESYRQAGGYTAAARAAALLAGLGFDELDRQRSAAEFSGGWRVRLGLARALMCPSDLLLLDEPTNHLDLETVVWLEGWLQSYPGTLLVISHDRDFLDAVIGEVLHIEGRALHHYRGGYSDFERQRAARLASQQAAHTQQQRTIARMEQFIDRFRAKATKARAAQSRLKALERMRLVAPVQAENPFRFRFREPDSADNPLLELRDAALGYGGRPVLQGVGLELAPGDRIGLLGANGAGKSTLIRTLAGELPPLCGELHTGPRLRIGYFAQHQLEQLDPAASPLLHLQRLDPAAAEQRLRDFLGGFGFSGDRATAPVAPRSGGEKARLVLALLAWRAPGLLLLDEPTNHLDLDMRAALTLALQDYSGALVLVSHDRHLLTTAVDGYWRVADGRLTRFAGDLDDYRRQLAQERLPAEVAAPSGGRREERRRGAERRAELRPLRERAARLAAELDRAGAELAELDARLGAPELYAPQARGRLQELLGRQGALRRHCEHLETDWIAAEEALEAARARD